MSDTPALVPMYVRAHTVAWILDWLDGTIRIIQEVIDDRGAYMRVYADENFTVLAATARGCTHALPTLSGPPPPGETVAALHVKLETIAGLNRRNS